MNLCIDDAVEVRLASKSSPEEKRRPLGMRPDDPRYGRDYEVLTYFQARSY